MQSVRWPGPYSRATSSAGQTGISAHRRPVGPGCRSGFQPLRTTRERVNTEQSPKSPKRDMAHGLMIFPNLYLSRSFWRGRCVCGPKVAVIGLGHCSGKRCDAQLESKASALDQQAKAEALGSSGQQVRRSKLASR